MSRSKFTCPHLHGTKCDDKCDLGKFICCRYCKRKNKCSDDKVCGTYDDYRTRKKMEERKVEKVIFT